MSPVNRQDRGLRAAFADELPVRRIVMICGWCPNREARTAALRARGFDVSHGLCPACDARLHAELDAAEALA